MTDKEALEHILQIMNNCSIDNDFNYIKQKDEYCRENNFVWKFNCPLCEKYMHTCDKEGGYCPAFEIIGGSCFANKKHFGIRQNLEMIFLNKFRKSERYRSKVIKAIKNLIKEMDKNGGLAESG